MTPKRSWIGWGLMAVGWAISLLGACWYLGGKLDAILKVLRVR